MVVEVNWASGELQAALAQLSSQQANGVIRIVEAELDGKPISSLMDTSGQMCTSTTYYGSGKRKGWRDKPTFQAALTYARRDYRTWLLQNGTSEALHILADGAAPAARALRQNVEGDADALMVLIGLLEDEDAEVRKMAAHRLGEAGLPSMVPYLTKRINREENSAVRMELIAAIGAVASSRDSERRLSAEAILDRADVKTAAKQALNVSEDDINAEIRRLLGALAPGRSDEAPGGIADQDEAPIL